MNNIVIFSAGVARDLIRENYNLVDIKPDTHIKFKTIFFFENTQEIRNYLEEKHNILI